MQMSRANKEKQTTANSSASHPPASTLAYRGQAPRQAPPWHTANVDIPYRLIIMQGNPEVLDYLNQLLRGELAARDQYFIHSRFYEHLGFTQLYERMNHEMEEETQHADALIRRILMLDGIPDMRPNAFEPGKDVVG